MAENSKKETQRILDTTREDLKELERYVQEYSSFMPLPVGTANPTGTIVDINEAFQDLTGYKEIEIAGQKVKSIFKNPESFRKIESQALEGKKQSLKEGVIITKQEEEIPVRIDAGPRKDREGNIIGYFFALSNISEFKQLQENLEERVEKRTQEAEKRAEELADSRKALMNILEDVEETKAQAQKERDKTVAIIQNFPAGIIFFDTQKKVSSANPKIKEFFGVDPEELIGKTVSEMVEISELSSLMDILGEKLKKVSKEEIEKEEDLVLEVSTIEVTREETGRGTLVVIRDVTREKLIQKMKTEFVSIAAHQLRTPLSAIKWTLKMLLEGDAGEINEDQNQLLNKSYKSNERMIKLINDLLNVTRIEEGRFLYEVESENLVEIVKKVADPLKKTAERKGLDFILNLPEEKNVPNVKVDKEKISLAAQNLVENAIHYTDQGKVEIDLEFQKDKKRFLFSVEDTGIGIPKSEQSRIFTKFFRAPSAVKSETKGTGLGLFIAKNIVEAHGGKIWFKSAKGEGTTFYFTIPVESEQFERFIEGI